MRNAAARKRETAEESGFENLLQELWRLHKTLTLENYLQVLDNFADNARNSLAKIQDKRKREHLREQYRRVIEFAVDLACGNPS